MAKEENKLGNKDLNEKELDDEELDEVAGGVLFPMPALHVDPPTIPESTFA